MKNTNLINAKKEKNDEFYTLYEDIEKELKYYKEHFKNKIVYCNCDDPKKSNFWKYFYDNFNTLKLKKLIATYYDPNNSVYKYEYDGANIKIKILNGNGDFRSEECIELLKEADLIITNPPFSLFREYVSQLIEYEKKFIIIGNINAITNKKLFSYIRDNKIWIGSQTQARFFYFEVPEDYESIKEIKKECIRKFGQDYCNKHNMTYMRIACWFTNLDHKKIKKVILYKTYKGNESKYPKYDNYDAIEVNRVTKIPIDYNGIMGVPITFIYKYNPEQFEIIDVLKTGIINGKRCYSRLLIKYKGD